MSPRHRASLRALALFAGAVGVLSCDLNVAPGSVFSISKLLLPSPGLVVGDTMRDSTGAVAPLRVIAFTTTGDTAVGSTPVFITIDTLSHLVGGNKLVGDFVGTTRVIGGIGNVQTLAESLKVTLSPDSIAPVDSTLHTKTWSILADTVVTSADLNTQVLHRGVPPTGVDAVIVKYTIVSMPPSKNSFPTVTLVNGSLTSSRDTTVSGKAGRAVRLRINNRANIQDDSAVVQATASYRGVSLGTITFRVLFKSQ